MLNEPIIILDFETTGLRSEYGDRVIEVAALRVQGRNIVERFETLVGCRANIPPHITHFTGITVDMIDSAPLASQVFPELLAFIGSDPVIAHNAAFDQGFLESECSRLRLPYRHQDFICSVKLARLLFPEMRTHALGALASTLGLAFTPGAHRAGADAQATVGVVLRMIEILREQYPLMTIDARFLRELLRAPAQLEKFKSAADGINEIRAA